MILAKQRNDQVFDKRIVEINMVTKKCSNYMINESEGIGAEVTSMGADINVGKPYTHGKVEKERETDKEVSSRKGLRF